MAIYAANSPTQQLTVGQVAVSASIDPSDPVLYILNAGNSVINVAIGRGPQTATSGALAVPFNVPMYIPTFAGADTISAINLVTGNETVYISTGAMVG